MAQPPGSGPTNPAGPQRHWQAPCPNCGAPVEFQSAASPVAVCSFCRSTVVRDGESLRKIGESAELFDDHTPLQLGASGQLQERAFTLVGRLQYGYGAGIEPGGDGKVDGSWNEWHALFADGASGWLSEDNDQYVMAFDVRPDAPLPPAESLRPGLRLGLIAKQWQVASLVRTKLLAAQGELPAPPALGQVYTVADLRNAQNQVATIDYADAAHPVLSVGLSVRLADLRLRGLREEPGADTKMLASRGFPCPNCGAPVAPKLAGTLSISCDACHSVIDLSQGIGGELQAFEQRQRFKPKIPLGKSGVLAIAGLPPLSWQVVGFAQRRGVGNGTFTWADYLLYNAAEGFAFLNDTEDGWVGWRTMTGVPEGGGERGANVVGWNGVRYRLTDSYLAEALYVEGEFYWKVQQGQRLRNADYSGTGAASGRRLSREESDNEVVWSQGGLIPASSVADAFGLPPELRRLIRPDVAPTSGSNISLSTVVVIVLILLVLFLLPRCGGYGGGYYGTAGGAYGGYSSGGGHK